MRHLTPFEQISQIEIPLAALKFLLNLRIEIQHLLERLVGNVGVQLCTDDLQIDPLEHGEVDRREAIEERLGQSLSSAHLSVRILTGEDTQRHGRLLVVNVKRSIQLGNVDLSTMIETRIQTFQHRLIGQVKLEW